jgi:type VI protein secretion system component VasK
MSEVNGFVRWWFAFATLLCDALVGLYVVATIWMLVTDPSLLVFYGVFFGLIALVAYLMWRVRRARARRASKAARVRLDLSGP